VWIRISEESFDSSVLKCVVSLELGVVSFKLQHLKVSLHISVTVDLML
jgi:hypothetical protein